MKEDKGMEQKKIISRAGKELLLKTVVQAIPSYAMSVFLLNSVGGVGAHDEFILVGKGSGKRRKVFVGPLEITYAGTKRKVD